MAARSTRPAWAARRAWAALACWASVCCALCTACSEDKVRDRGDPDAAISLWPIPVTGQPNPPAGVTAVTSDAGRTQSPAYDAGAPDPRWNGLFYDAAVTADDDAGVMPPDPHLEIFDLDEVYLFGTLSEGACYLDAVAPVLAPDEAVVGFDCGADEESGQIRPTDGRLLYTANGGGFVFRCDGCRYARPGIAYPKDPQANDDPIPMPSCDSYPASTSGLLVSPDGAILHYCGAAWYDEQGRKITERPLYSLGASGTALEDDGVLDLASLTVVPFSGLPATKPLTARADPDGYRLVLASDADPTARELWFVGLDGNATMRGAYPPLPAGHSVGGTPRLDASGRLYELSRYTSGNAVLRDAVVRRSVDGQSDVVYDEANDPIVKVHISGLFTGP